MSVGRFLGMIGALIWCPSTKKYLVLRRSAEKDYASNMWECGTGRVDQGESFTEALFREIHEELKVDIQLDFILGTAHFYRGDTIPENEMIGVFYSCSLEDPDSLQTSWEHSEYRWVAPDEIGNFISEDHWLYRLIERAEVMRALIPSDLIEYLHLEGLEV